MRSGPLPVRRALELALAVADGLSFAHEQGSSTATSSRRTSSSARAASVKVTDFGIARSLDAEQRRDADGHGARHRRVPRAGAGERRRRSRRRRTSTRSASSSGRCSPGASRSTGDNFVAVALRHVNEPPPAIRECRSDVPPRLAAAVEKALQKDPAERFPSMAAFAAELRACLARAGSRRRLARRPSSPLPRLAAAAGRRGRRRSARRWPVYVALAVVVGIAALVAALLLGGGGAAAARPAVSSGTPVRLRGVTAYDPQGGGAAGARLHGACATDGNPSTSGRRRPTRPGSSAGSSTASASSSLAAAP